MARALDLFCKAGGAGKGLSQAGFTVLGIDIEPQPRYPFEFKLADAFDCAPMFRDFDLVWASPKCQRWTPRAQGRGTAETHEDQVTPLRPILEAMARERGNLWCMENVPRSPLRRDLILTGDMFGMRTYRKRVFEMNFFVMAPPHRKPFGPKTRPGSVTVAGASGGSSNRDGWQNGRKDAWQEAMGIDWMTNEEMANAVPPAYAEFIGRAAMDVIRHRARAAE